MASHNSDEARLFINPDTSDTQAAFDAFLAAQFPAATRAQVEYINSTLYPPPPPSSVPLARGSGSSLSYSTHAGRLALLDADVYNICWTVLLAATYAPYSHNYIFSIPPGYHAQDLAYTFYNGKSFQKQVDVEVARILQRAIANFVVGGDPNGGDGGGGGGGQEGRLFPAWRAGLGGLGKGGWGKEGVRVANLTGEGVKGGDEAGAAGRCKWWLGNAFAGSN